MSIPETRVPVRIEVPATSANLGPGYDCLGITLDMGAMFSIRAADELDISGCDERYWGEDNLIWRSYRDACAEYGFDAAPISIAVDSQIPDSGGLGSSAACRIAGIGAAQVHCLGRIDRKGLIELASRYEGHPDNVVPALLGGFVASFSDGNEIRHVDLPVSEKLRFVAMAPEKRIETEDARGILPDAVPLSDLVWQTGHAIALVEALREGDCALIRAACADRVHEPLRAGLIECYEPLRSACLGAGAAAFCISGSGSAMIAICEEERAGDVREAVSREVAGIWARICSLRDTGASFEFSS